MPNTVKILVVDDEPKAVSLLENLLRPEGYRILTAHSGAAALALAAVELPDVVLLDVMMPEMDGFAVCSKFRCDPRLAHVPILMLTALDDRSSLLNGIEAGADDFITKPFDSTELRARLRTITRLNRFRQLYDERARLEVAVDYAPYGVILAELDGTILQRNRAFDRLLAPGQPALDQFFAYLPTATAARVRGELETGAALAKPVETALNFSANPATVVEISCTLVRWQGRQIVHFMVRDLTEQKQLEQQLIHSQRIELLGQLAGSAVHDINNLLTAIYGHAQMLEMKNGADLSTHIGHILTSTRHGATVLQQLLMFARGDDGVLAPINAAGVTAEVVHMIQETFGRRYAVEFNSDPGLPPVLADATQIHQIVMNLCVNARDAMPDGGRLEIGINRRTVAANLPAVMGDKPAPGPYVALAIRDHGTGIPPAVLPKLFDPFFTTKPKGKGTGLGLATVIRLMRRHKGFVTLETEMGRGTCFTCYFPAVPHAGA
jgi:signal transduction histidine kinase